jgi:hypothetical protein
MRRDHGKGRAGEKSKAKAQPLVEWAHGITQVRPGQRQSPKQTQRRRWKPNILTPELILRVAAGVSAAVVVMLIMSRYYRIGKKIVKFRYNALVDTRCSCQGGNVRRTKHCALERKARHLRRKDCFRLAATGTWILVMRSYVDPGYGTIKHCITFEWQVPML